jgi:Tfp pilus assembly protein PilF
MNRLETLKNLVAQDPGNTFARYGLAMEYTRAGEFARAAEEFRGLLEIDPDHAYAHYHGAQALEKLGKLEEARKMYRDGIEAATRKGDAHACSELETALELLG